MGSSVGPWSGPSCGGSAKGAQALDITDASGIKARKPYTITKQRERWTDEEHSKFLEGLRLFGRAWRKIEEFIGSKTSIQIRSHAQKFFSKVERRGKEPSGELNEVADMDVTAIPPPRPKRKPARPYPKNEHSDSGNGGGGGGGPGEASTMFASAAGGNGGSMGGGGGGGGAGFSNMPQVGGAYMEGSNGVSHHHHYYHHRQQQQQQAPPAYYPCYSDSDVSEATVAAVAAAASAAAAAAAASVIAAAGQHVQAHLQRHPPQGFPFFGVPPSLLAQASLRNPALEAYVHANGLANASEYQWQAGVDPRQRAAQLRSALAEATATNEGGGGSGMSSGRDSDGDSACSRETDDMDSEGAEDGSGAGPNGGGGAPAAAELRAMEMKAAVASWHAGGNGGGVQAHMQEAVQLPLQSRAASGAALHCGAAPQCRLSPGLVDSGGGSKPSADCGTATPTLQGSGESNASRAKRHASNEVATSVRLDHKKVRQQSPDEDSGQCADTLPKGPAGEGQSGGGSVDGATPRRNDSSGSEEDTRAAHGAALHDVQQPRRPAHVQAQVSDPSTPGCGNGSTGSGAQANTSSGNGNGSSGAREGNGSNGSGSDGNGSDGAGNGSDGNGQGSGAATLAARGSGTGREDHIIRAGTASGPPRPADHVHAPASTPGGTHPKRRLRQSSHAALLALDDPGAAGGSRLAAPAVPPVEPSTHTVRPASPWPGHGSALVAAGSLQSATAPRAASVHATATAPPPHASHVAVGASEPSAWAPPTHFTDAHGAPGMVDNMGRLSSGIETSTLQRMLSSVQGQGQAAFAPFLAPPPATAFTSQGGLFAVPPPHPRSSQYRLAHTSLPLPGAASTQVLPPPTQLRFGSDGRGLAAPWPGILLPPQQQQQQQPLAYGLASGLGGLAAAPALNTSWLFHPPAQQQQQPYLSAYPVRQLTSSESELVATMDQDRQLQRTRQAPSAPLGFAPPGLPYGASQQVVGSAAARRMSEH